MGGKVTDSASNGALRNKCVEFFQMGEQLKWSLTGLFFKWERFNDIPHEFLLKGEPPPECIPCNCLLTIKHLLIECVDFNDVRQRFYQVPSLQDLFKTVKPEVILEFLKAAALYRLL